MGGKIGQVYDLDIQGEDFYCADFNSHQLLYRKRDRQFVLDSLAACADLSTENPDRLKKVQQIKTACNAALLAKGLVLFVSPFKARLLARDLGVASAIKKITRHARLVSSRDQSFKMNREERAVAKYRERSVKECMARADKRRRKHFKKQRRRLERTLCTYAALVSRGPSLSPVKVSHRSSSLPASKIDEHSHKEDLEGERTAPLQQTSKKETSLTSVTATAVKDVGAAMRAKSASNTPLAAAKLAPIIKDCHNDDPKEVRSSKVPAVETQTKKSEKRKESSSNPDEEPTATSSVEQKSNPVATPEVAKSTALVEILNKRTPIKPVIKFVDKEGMAKSAITKERKSVKFVDSTTGVPQDSDSLGTRESKLDPVGTSTTSAQSSTTPIDKCKKSSVTSSKEVFKENTTSVSSEKSNAGGSVPSFKILLKSCANNRAEGKEREWSISTPKKTAQSWPFEPPTCMSTDVTYGHVRGSSESNRESKGFAYSIRQDQSHGLVKSKISQKEDLMHVKGKYGIVLHPKNQLQFDGNPLTMLQGPDFDADAYAVWSLQKWRCMGEN